MDLKNFSRGRIKEAIWDCGGSKSPDQVDFIFFLLRNVGSS